MCIVGMRSWLSFPQGRRRYSWSLISREGLSRGIPNIVRSHSEHTLSTKGFSTSIYHLWDICPLGIHQRILHCWDRCHCRTPGRGISGRYHSLLGMIHILGLKGLHNGHRNNHDHQHIAHPSLSVHAHNLGKLNHQSKYGTRLSTLRMSQQYH